MSELTREEKSKYLSEILEVTRASMNEEQLKIGCEEILKRLLRRTRNILEFLHL